MRVKGKYLTAVYKRGGGEEEERLTIGGKIGKTEGGDEEAEGVYDAVLPSMRVTPKP